MQSFHNQNSVEISIKCEDLPDLDAFSKTDAFAVVSKIDKVNKSRVQIGRTETIKNNINPKFLTTITIDYVFQEDQIIRIDLYDQDSSSGKLKDHDYIGYCVTSLRDIILRQGQNYYRNLLHPNSGNYVTGRKKAPSMVILNSKLSSGNREILKLHLRGRKLKKMDLLSSDPYIEILTEFNPNEWKTVCKTEPVKKNLNPVWQPFSISCGKLCGSDKRKPVLLKCFDYDRNSSDDLIGCCFVSVEQLLKQNNSFELNKLTDVDFNTKTVKNTKKKKSRGTIEILDSRLFVKYTFLDYINAGINISLMVAIDFTGSNGPPGDPRSLHYCGPDGNNEYLMALNSVGGILCPYDSNGRFHVWGFGGHINNVTSHCFSLTFNQYQQEVIGLEGIKRAYFNALNLVKLSGPTNLAQIFSKASEMAAAQQNMQHYHVLLVLTDGVISDMRQSIDSIIAASRLPLSIVIVGVGGANFKDMRILDADNGLLRQGSRVAARDIVQFVPFRQVNRSFTAESGSRLASEVLREIPTQLVSYMEMTNQQPVKYRREFANDNFGQQNRNDMTQLTQQMQNTSLNQGCPQNQGQNPMSSYQNTPNQPYPNASMGQQNFNQQPNPQQFYGQQNFGQQGYQNSPQFQQQQQKPFGQNQMSQNYPQKQFVPQNQGFQNYPQQQPFNMSNQGQMPQNYQPQQQTLPQNQYQNFNQPQSYGQGQMPQNYPQQQNFNQNQGFPDTQQQPPYQQSNLNTRLPSTNPNA